MGPGERVLERRPRCGQPVCDVFIASRRAGGGERLAHIGKEIPANHLSEARFQRRDGFQQGAGIAQVGETA